MSAESGIFGGRLARRRAGKWTSFVMLALVAVACRRESASESNGTASAAPTAARAPSMELSSGTVVRRLGIADRNAFDLVASNHGTLLIAARPSKNGAELSGMFFDSDGNAGRTWTVPIPGAGPVVEVAAGGAGEHFAAAWIIQTREGMEAFAALGKFEEGALGAASSLGPATVATTERGHIAVGAAWSPPGVTAAQRFIVFHRGSRVPCSDAPAGCVEFPLHEVEASKVTPRRVTLAVPAPCGRAIAGFSAETTRWYYGVCALENGRASTTMFTIEHSPEYAEAERVLEGCVPIGATVLGGSAILVGRCAGRRRAVRLGSRIADAVTTSIEDLHVGCEDGKLALHARGAGALDAVLDGPSPDIAPVLPEWMAPADARAVWTGKALLVASAEGREVAIRRFGCHTKEAKE